MLNPWGKILSGNAAIVVSKVDGGQVRGSRLIGTARFVGQREHILEKAFLRLSVAVQRISQHRSLSLLFVSRCENVNFFSEEDEEETERKSKTFRSRPRETKPRFRRSVR